MTMVERPVLVVGATGSTGRRVTRRLREAGLPVRPVSRATPVPFDWSQPSTWVAAVNGAAALYLMAPDGTAVDPAFVTYAVGHGVERVVLLSSTNLTEMGDERLLAAEQTVQESGAEWTILHPTWFDQNFDEGFFRGPVMSGELVTPIGDLRQGFVDAEDIAAVAVAALTGPGHADQTYELTGPEALTFAEAVAVISQLSGRRVRFAGTPDRYLQTQLAAGVPRDRVIAEIDMFAAIQARGDDAPTDVVHRVTGRTPTRFADYAAAAAARGAWRD